MKNFLHLILFVIVTIISTVFLMNIALATKIESDNTTATSVVAYGYNATNSLVPIKVTADGTVYTR